MSRSVPSLPASAVAILRPSSGDADAMTSLGTAARWRPGLPQPEQHPCHSEIFANSSEAAGAGMALALALDALEASAKDPLAVEDQRYILWVQTREAMLRNGRPYHHGLPCKLRRRLIHVEVQTARDALFALEEGVRCRDFAFVIGEVRGNPRELDFIASRRLTLTAQRHSTRLYLVRLDAKPDLSSARMRWNVRSAPSPRPRWDNDAPGIAAWEAELFRARAHPPGQWTLHNEDSEKGRGLSIGRRPAGFTIPQPANTPGITAHYGDMVRPTVGRSLAAL